MKRILRLLPRYAVTAVAVLVALFFARWMWNHYQVEPWTRDGRVRADVVQLAPDVSGEVTTVHVRDNRQVHKGEVLFVIDRSRFELALAQAEATVASRQAELAQAEREAHRNKTLKDLVSEEVREQGITRVELSRAALQRAIADRNVAALNLERTSVRSPVNGVVTNLTLQVGDFATAGKQAVAVVNSESFRVEGYFEETKLARIRTGDPVSIHIMGEEAELRGHVESIAAGIEDRDRTQGPSMLPNVNPTFSWVRLAQRVPVRIALDELPEGVHLVAGRTATVTVLPREEPVQSAVVGNHR